MAATVAAAGLGLQGVASADTLSAIEQCESGGRNAKNPHSTASGYYQIVNGTWRAHGGTKFAPTARGATKAEQRIIAARIAAARGSYADWNASKHCWGSKASGKLPKNTSKGVSEKRASKRVVIKRGDTFNGLADRLGVSPAVLRDKNPHVKNIHRIRAGQTLRT